MLPVLWTLLCAYHTCGNFHATIFSQISFFLVIALVIRENINMNIQLLTYLGKYNGVKITVCTCSILMHLHVLCSVQWYPGIYYFIDNKTIIFIIIIELLSR